MRIKILIPFVVFALLIHLPACAIAGETTITPSLTAQGIYDDNLDWEAEEEEQLEDFAADVIAAINLNYQSELLNFNALAEGDFLYYLEEKDFDRINQRYGFDSRYQFASRWIAGVEAAFIRDQTIDSQLEETGRVFDRRTRNRYEAGAGLIYQVSELSSILPNIIYRRNDYDDPGLIDNYYFTGLFPFETELKTRRDRFGLYPAYTYFNSDVQESDNYELVAMWERQFSEISTFRIELGPRLTDLEDKETNENTTSWGGVGELALSHTGETFVGSLLLSNNITPDTEGNIINVSRLVIQANQKLHERFGVRFKGIGALSIRVQGPDDQISYVELRPGLYYLITPNASLDFTYSYQNQIELDVPGDPTTQRNRVWFGVNIDFPQKW